MDARGQTLGVVTEGSFSSGITVRLASSCSTEDLRVGSFVVLEGDANRYFSLITDMSLHVTDAALAADPPEHRSPFIQRALAGRHTYATVRVRPSLMIEDKNNLAGGGPVPVRNIPMHFAHLRDAVEEDFNFVFGEEGGPRFALGTPPTMDIPIPIDLGELVTRSNGIFGQSGTGKSVLTRLLLYGIIKSDVASVLVFDMHGEYARYPQGDTRIVGLVDLFGRTRIKEYSLDSRLGVGQHLTIGLNQIEPGDIELLADELALTPTFAQNAHLLRRQFRDRWIQQLLELDGDGIEQFCRETGANRNAIDALRQKLDRLQDRDYILSHGETSAIDDMLLALQRGSHVVLTFGRHNSLLDYMLVANIVTRRIHQRYTDQLQQQEASGQPFSEPRRLVVVLEEAHKFLTPDAARQSIFGTIAREMRKYSVTLLVVDQRPSGIDPEVLSQLGTRITGLLTDSRDIDAVLTGVSDRNQMRSLLASLQPRQECLIIGHAVPMPVMLRTRDYDEQELRRPLEAAGIRAPNGKHALTLLNEENDE